VTPVRSDREQQRFRASFEKIDRLYAGAFKRLAR
jgi:hypothetical protein